MSLGRGGPTNEEEKKGIPLKRRYFISISSSNVKMVADRPSHRHAAYPCHSDELLRNVNIDDLN